MTWTIELTVKLIIAIFAGYMIGSLNSALIVGKFYGVDVREKGSGNPGMTNMFRTLGKKAGILTTFGDIAKTAIACLVGSLIIGFNSENINIIGTTLPALGVMAGGVAATIGHNWPIYFKFKGGKGILTTLTVIIMMDWRIAILLFGIFLIILFIFKYVSLGSVISVALLPFTSLIPYFEKDLIFLIFSSVLSVMAIYRHRANIVRIINGTESKFKFNKSKQ